MGMKLASLADIELFADFGSKGTSKSQLVKYLELVSSQIQTHLNRTLIYGTISSSSPEYYTTNNTARFQLKRFPIDLAEDFKVYVNSTGTFAEKTVDEDYWIWDERGTVEFNYRIWSYKPKNIYFEYTGGYSEISINTTEGSWQADTAYSLDDRILVSTNVYRCTTAGTSGAIIPTFDTGVAETTTDNTVTWTEDSGYDGVLDVPTDITYACLKQVNFAIRNRKEPGVISVSTPDGNKTKENPGVLQRDVKNLLIDYKRFPIRI